MSELIHSLGIDWKLLLAQGLNFLVILVVLRFTVYRPLLEMLRKRRERIEQGAKDAAEAEKKLASIKVLEQDRLGKAEARGMEVIAEAEERAKAREAEMVNTARVKEREILETADRMAKAKQLEAEGVVYAEAAKLIRQGLEKVVAKAPKSFDEALIAEAVEELKHKPQ